MIRTGSRSLAVGLSVLVASSCGAGDGAPQDQPPETMASTAVAEVRPFDVVVTATGTITAHPSAHARLSAPGETVVTAIDVGEGDRVRAGQRLVELDASVWGERLRQAQAALATAEEALSRAQRLVDQGILPRKDLEAASAERARANAEVADAQRTHSRAVLRSPIDGTVAAMRATLAQPVTSGEVLVEVVDPTKLEAQLRLSPSEAARVPNGAPARVTASLQQEAEDLASGHVAGVSAAVDSATGAVTVRVSVDSVQRVLRPGETVAAHITVARHERAVVIPREALVPEADGLVVFVLDSAGVVHEAPVEVGAEVGAFVEVLKGLVGGERIVTTGAYGVAEGTRILDGVQR
ncbi:MAG: efflux RND transporter periplasmic adaptor subunit [Gemmatimonadota bacterium]